MPPKRPAASTFSPSDVTGLVGWWDASVASSITSAAGRVTQWNDLSGSGYHLTAATTARPTTGSNTMNGNNVLTFDGVANELTKSSAVTPAVNTGTWIAVAKPTATTGYERLVAFEATGQDFDDPAAIAAIIRDGSNLAYNSFYNGGGVGTVAVTNAAHVIETQRNGDTFSCWRDGTAGTGATGLGTTVFGFTFINIGSNFGNNFWTGDIAEVLWYSTAISTANRQSIESYLKTKWGTP